MGQYGIITMMKSLTVIWSEISEWLTCRNCEFQPNIVQIVLGWRFLHRTDHLFSKKYFFFSMIWYNHIFGQIRLLNIIVLRWLMWYMASCFGKFHQILMQFVKKISLSDSKLNPLSPIYQLPEALTFNRTRNHLRASPFVFTPYLHSVINTVAQTSDHPTKQCRLQNTPLNNVDSRPSHWTMWTPDHPTEQCELQTIPLNNVNSRPSHWTMWTTDHPTERCELQTIPLNNLNFIAPH